ncbi:alpha/beta hydrolase [Pseudonocardia hydrocarbonoxydans]|uniref:Peptidase n=1 Tax=Pseudonocardia hydrocarbonoxydans TaxID=76726 RepID=A0A4Y3WHQ9_9PSEU|nr:alpha/beta hydrolase [Pseudonocardia hydrocarbonoxydans]GEC18477.1 peptidase [Pseudonocardia hydrocarbonoxydans]
MIGNPRSVVAGLLCLCAVLTGCTVGPSQRPPVAVRGPDVAAAPPAATPEPSAPAVPPLQPQNTSIPFVDCTAGAFAAYGVTVPADRTLRVECGELPVPADPARPEQGSVLLGVLRVGPAGSPLDGPPLLALGDSATLPSAGHALDVAARASPAVLDTFTVLGLDRRGSGIDRIDCAEPAARAALVDADPAATAETDLAPLLERARSVVQDCNLALPSALGGFRSAATAADVEQLRIRLGVAQLSAVGAGDGAGALDVWARTAPGGVGRLVLDGPPDPAVTEPERTRARAATAEAAFDAFALDCTGRGACPLGPDPRAAVTALADALRERPLLAADGRRLTAGAALLTVLTVLNRPEDRPALAAGLAAAAAGDPAPLLGLLDPVAGPAGGFDAMLATACNDNPARLSPPEVSTLATELRADHPLIGGTLALGLLACAPWPAGGATEVSPPAGALPPVLVVGTVADPRHPAEGARRVAERLPAGAFVTWQGAGTGAYPRTPCVRSAVEALLVDGLLPASGTLCPP